MIYLTSFDRSVKLPKTIKKLSAAVYQPYGFKYPKVDWTDIRDQNGNWIRPRNFLGEPSPLIAYRQALIDLYMSRLPEAQDWAWSLEGDVALCCWCPYDKAAQRQLKEHGSFVCHTAVLGEFISNALQLPVWYDGDRRQMAVLTQL